MDDETFLRRFEDGTLSENEWHHLEHIKVAYLYLQRYSLDEAIDRMRSGLKRLNAALRVPEALDRGYHETLTQAWMRLVHFTLHQYGAVASADEFFQQHPQLSQPKVLRLFYSRDRLMSAHAKAEFLAPDLTNFPQRKMD
jgi:hypothetical protein